MPDVGLQHIEPEQHADTVLEQAAEKDPDRVFALVSGGHDSTTAMHVAHQSDHLDLDAVVHINTNVGIEQTREFVRERCQALDLAYMEITNFTPWERYDQIVLEYGFPSPATHDYVYEALKGRPLDGLRQSFDGQLQFVSGVWRHESDNRMASVPVSGLQDDGRVTWVSPLVEWTALDIRRYRRRHGLPMNEVVDILEMSGECLCGAYADRRELDLLRECFHDTWRFLQCLETKAQLWADADDSDTDFGPPDDFAEWAHHSDNRAAYDAGQLEGPGRQQLLCQDCRHRDTD